MRISDWSSDVCSSDLTMALQDAVAQSPSTAFAAVLHAIVLDAFYFTSRESCLEISLSKVSFSFPPAGLKDSAPAGSITERHMRWKARLPKSDRSEEHTSELQSLMRISYAVFCLKKKRKPDRVHYR